MISFLNGFILPALFAASIPILLHFLSRKKARKMPFSSIKFLKVIENQRIKRVKLYQFLLILVRTLFIVFLVIAFARPTVTSLLGNVSGNAQTTAVIIIDDSYSMQAFASSQTYMEIAKQQLSEIVAVFNTQDKVFLLSGFDKKPVLINSLNRDKSLKNIKPSNAVLNLERLLISADSLFTTHPNLNNELYILSDFKLTDHKPFAEYSFNSTPNFKAYKIDLAQEPSFKNVSIDSIVLNNQLIETGSTINISAYISNHDPQNKMETNLNLYNEDMRVAMSFVELQPGESKVVEIPFVPQKPGTHYLNLQIDEDDLFVDNKFYFSLFMKEKIKALFVSDLTADKISLATKVLSQNSLFDIDPKRQNEWPGTNLSLYDFVILNDFENTSEANIEKLGAYLKSGKSILVIPGEKLTVADYNNFFKKLESPVRFGKINSGGPNSFYSLENEKAANSIFDALFRDKKNPFSPPKIFRYYTQTGFDKSMINLSNRNTFLSKSGGLYVFSSAFSQNWSSFEINGLFLPLLYRSFYIAAQTKNPLSGSIVSGEAVVFNSDGINIENRFSIKPPNNSSISVIPKSMRNKLYFDGGIAVDPGFYLLMENQNVIGAIAANHSADELKKPFISSSSFEFDLKTLDSDKLNQQILNARTGFELWLVFLILALSMLLLEQVLIKRIEGLPLFG
ncbi:MAG: hypothetical protein D8M58_08545 [Calditrichaeota bacterium]|nr:MAG: hypothetical protein DWQ03_17945 [Calditrichota bacterium]MBL1205431.1 hypothetical protein [Calditrichota bacterium]NOG45260.1 hypothetical protein [Calditrichota bacterium]